MKEPAVSITQACGMLGISSPTLYRYKDKGLLQIIPPQQAMVRVSDIERILEERDRRKVYESNEV